MKVNLTKRVKTKNGLRYCPVAYHANGKPKEDWVLVGGQVEFHPEGSYYLDWYAKRQVRIRRAVGPDLGVAQTIREAMQISCTTDINIQRSETALQYFDQYLRECQGEL